jgi:phosphohistidine phosphatase SixA
MKVNLKNRYFFLRHGKNIHQTELKDIIYCYPDDETPCSLIEEGIEQAKKAGEELKDKKIEYIYCSDILRTRQTAKIAPIIPHRAPPIKTEIKTSETGNPFILLVNTGIKTLLSIC